MLVSRGDAKLARCSLNSFRIADHAENNYCLLSADPPLLLYMAKFPSLPIAGRTRARLHALRQRVVTNIFLN